MNVQVASEAIPSIPEANPQQIIQGYEQQHRLRLAEQLAYILAVVGYLSAVVLTIYCIRQGVFFTTPVLAMGVLGTALGITILLFFSYWAARHQHTTLSVSIIVYTFILLSIAAPLAANFFQTTLHVQPEFTMLFFIIGIIVVGLLRNLRTLIFATAAFSIYSCVVAFYLLPRLLGQAPGVTAATLLTVLLLLVAQWGTAGMVGAGRSSQQLAFRELASAQEVIERAKQLDDLKDQFISSVNHELRNPLMAMMNYVTVLNQRNDQMPALRRSQILGSLEETGKRVIQLVGSILDVRYMAEHPEEFQPSPVSVTASIKTAASLLDPTLARMEERELSLQIPSDLEIWGDGTYLQQIFTNLLSNAVKYSPPGSPIDIEATIVRDSAANRQVGASNQNMVEIIIRDHGLGVPADQIPLLFNRFVRLSRDMTSSVSGNGLGLYLCKVLTEAMGGHIWVESSGIEGEGSSFHVLLQAVPETQVAPADAQMQSAAVPARAPSPVLAGGPGIGQLRIAFSLILLTLVGIGVTLIEFPYRPATLPPIVATASFFDTNEGTLAGIRIDSTHLPALTAGTHYQAWMINQSSEHILSLGNVKLTSSGYTLESQGDEIGSNLLGIGNQVEITQERAQTLTPIGKVVALGTFPPDAFVHVQHLLFSFPSTPGKVGLLVGLLSQTSLLDNEAHQLQIVGSHDPALTQCLMTSMIDIIDGTGSVGYQTPSQQCSDLGISGGDGFGLITNASNSGYLSTSVDHAALAAQQPDTTPNIQTHADRLINDIATIETQVVSLYADLILINGQPSAAQIQQLTLQADITLKGTNTQTSTGGSPSANSGATLFGVQAAYAEGQMLAQLQLTTP